MGEILATGDGSATLRSGVILGADGLGETYHSLRGAVGEARHVFIEAGFRAFESERRRARANEVRPAAGGVGGLTTSAGSCVRVFEAGWGTGLNCWLTLLEAELTGRAVEYVGIERYPVPRSVVARLGYGAVPGSGGGGCGEASGGESCGVLARGGEGSGCEGCGVVAGYGGSGGTGCGAEPTDGEASGGIGSGRIAGDPRFAALHAAPWGRWTQISPRFRLLKIEGDLTELFSSPLGVPHPLDRSDDGRTGPRDSCAESFRRPPPPLGGAERVSIKLDVVYWDAFAPDVQPELWSEELFARVCEATADGGVLVTYSSKGDVRRALRAAGFAVEKLPGALGKRHMLRARKPTSRVR